MIAFDKVTKIYPNGVKALENISLSIKQGEFVAVIGRSGAGKSTLIRAINKMHGITQGSLIVNDIDVSTLRGDALRKHRHGIGMIFQSFNLVNRTTAIKNVLVAKVPEMSLFRVLLGIYKKSDKIEALMSLDKVGILEKAFTRVDQLSGGQQQRVALARTLTQNPKIILADEPVAALDPVTARQVMDYFLQINKEFDITILINIHHVELALDYADRVIGIREGQLIFDGPPSEVTEDIISQIYAGKEEEGI